MSVFRYARMASCIELFHWVHKRDHIGAIHLWDIPQIQNIHDPRYVHSSVHIQTLHLVRTELHKDVFGYVGISVRLDVRKNVPLSDHTEMNTESRN